MSRLIVVGDIHARALSLGAASKGFETFTFSTSEGAWRDGSVTLSPDGSLSSERFRARQKIESFEAEVGSTPPLLSGVPVVASLAFHIPEFITQMRWHKLGTLNGAPKSAQSLVSPAFLREWIAESRSDMLGSLSAIAAQAPLVIVVPPLFKTGPLFEVFKAELVALVGASGLALFDPNEALADENGRLLDDHKHEDGRHGNEAFGTAVIEALLSRGLIPKPSA